MAGPLSGITVVELACIGPTLYAGMMLADMGARVIRIDRRPTSMPGKGKDVAIIERGRTSIAVDMKKPSGVEVVLRLVEHANVLIEGSRPGVAEALGVGPAVCLARNPQLVYGRMTGWGQTGPLAQSAGHDINFISLSGALYNLVPKENYPARSFDFIETYACGAMMLVVGVTAALFESTRSGQGQVIDASIGDAAATIATKMYGLQAEGRPQYDIHDGAAPFFTVYECADGSCISIAAVEPQFYRLLLEKCGLADSPLFRDQWRRSEWPTMKQNLTAVFRSRNRDEWCALLEGTDVCFAPVLSLEDAPHHPQNLARGAFVEAHGGIYPAPAPHFERTPSELSGPPPAIGEHTVNVLREIGYSEAEIEELINTEVVYREAVT